MPIETRRGGRAMFYQGRAMNALTVIAIMRKIKAIIFEIMNIKERIFIILLNSL